MISLDAVIILVLVIGIVLIVFAIGLRSRPENPMLLLHKSALGLRAMAGSVDGMKLAGLPLCAFRSS
jgi:hypothetical protein